MTMISMYLHLAWWLLPPALVLWWGKRYLLTPWARYVEHSPVTSEKKQYRVADETKQWFLTVRHVHWYPPFSDYDVTYRSFTSAANNRYWWAAEATGAQVSNGHDRHLTSIAVIADSRLEETAELLRSVR